MTQEKIGQNTDNERPIAAGDAPETEISDIVTPETEDDTNTQIKAESLNETENTVASDDAVDDRNGGSRKRKRKKRLKFYEVTKENDIKFRGPLSYRHLRIIGWSCFLIAQISTLISLAGKIDASAAPSEAVDMLLTLVSDMMMPLLLIATFATILNGSKSFKSMLRLYGVASVAFYLIFVLFHERYLAGTVSAMLEVDHATAVGAVDTLLTHVTNGGYIAFNLFIDLFLCTLLAFFLTYRPRKIFVGKKIRVFRCFALIPILYETASFLLKLFAAYDDLSLSPYIFPLLTTKPPMTFVVFVVIALFLSARESIFRKKRGEEGEYGEFVETNANSWRFSSFTAKILVVAGVIDLLICVILTFVLTAKGMPAESVGDDKIMEIFYRSLGIVTKCGVGESTSLILVAPIVLLFSYTRKYNNGLIDTLMPVIAIVLAVFIYIEGLYRILVTYIPVLRENIGSVLASL